MLNQQTTFSCWYSYWYSSSWYNHCWYSCEECCSFYIIGLKVQLYRNSINKSRNSRNYQGIPLKNQLDTNLPQLYSDMVHRKVKKQYSIKCDLKTTFNAISRLTHTCTKMRWKTECFCAEIFIRNILFYK